MDKKKKNIYDTLIEGLAANFQNTDAFKLAYAKEGSQKLFEFYIFRHQDLNLFKHLVLTKYIPVTNQVIAEDTKALRTSKYNHLLKISNEDSKEPVYELIRLSYIGLFHKYENFINNLLDCVINFHPETFSSRKELEDFFKSSFGFEFKDWTNSKSVNRINWICNCIKHYDGYPLKVQGFPDEFLNYPKDQKIKLTSQNFKLDVEAILIVFEMLFQIIPQIATLKNFATSSDKDLQLFGEEFLIDRKKNFEVVKEKVLATFEFLKII